MLAFLSVGVQFAEGLGEMFQFFHPSLLFPSLNQALLVFHMETWQSKREGPGWKREWEILQKLPAAHPEPDCATHIQTAQMTPILGNIPTNRLLCNSRMLVICLQGINSLLLFALSCAQTTPELGCSALQEISAPSCSTGLSCWIKHNWSWIPGLFCVSPYFHFLSISQVSSPSTSVNSGFKVFCQHQVSKTLWQICLGGQFLLPSLLQENVVF